MVLAKGPEDNICSARGCENQATKAVLWRNPKIPRPVHKTWLTCDEHTDFLQQYLAYRSFPTKVVPFSEVDSATLN